MQSGRRLLLATVSLLTLAAAVRLLILFVDFARGAGAVRAYHLESTGVAFVVSGVLVFLSRIHRQGGRSPDVTPEANGNLGLLVVFLALAFSLYWPALEIGLLSDDFVLLGHADQGRIGAGSDILFRPLVLLVWLLMRAADMSPASLHALNILLHGVAAFLTARVVAGWGREGWAGPAAGLFVLALPTAVEPVAWISGAFDVWALVLVLAAVLIARRPATPATRVSLWLVCVAAGLAKEIGVVTVPLIVVDAALRRTWPVGFRGDLAGIAMAATGYAFLRLQFLEGAYFDWTKYALQRMAFQAFGGLAQPWPAAVRASFGSVLSVSALVTLCTLFIFDGSRRSGRVIAASGFWILIAGAPVMTMLFVGPDLQGSRYLYASSPAWAALVVSLASGLRHGWVRRVGILLVFVLCFLNVWVTRGQLGAWREAGVVRESILLQLRSVVGGCPRIEVAHLPDSLGGAYIFRNGSDEAFRAAGLPPLGAAPAGCRFRWDQQQRLIIRD